MSIIKKLDVDEVLRKINFQVEKQDVYLEGKKSIDNRKALVRKDTNEVLEIVSDNYKLLENRKVFATPLEVMTKNDYYINRYSINNGGRKTIVELLSNDITTIPGKNNKDKDEEYRGRILFTNSYDKRSSLTMMFGIWRIICSNGAGVPMKDAVQIFRIVHLGESSKEFVKDKIISNIDTYQKTLKEYLIQLKVLSNTKIEFKSFDKIAEEIKLGEYVTKRIKSIYEESYSATGNLLGVFNAITQSYRDYEEKKQEVSLHSLFWTSILFKRLIGISNRYR